MEIGKLLYVMDFGLPSSSEVQCLKHLSSLGLKEVIFLHATKVEGGETRLAEHGISSRTLVVKRPKLTSILNTAHQEAVSLIVVSLNRDTEGRLRRTLTKGLLRSSTVPVLIIPEDAQASRSMEKGVFTHLLFATDWSPASEKALRYLLGLKTIVEALEVVHVIDRKLSVRDMYTLKYKLTESRKIFLDHGIDAEGHVYAGKTSEEIMLAARDYDATCIVMGTTGKSHLKDFFSPSYSYRVAEESVVPTLVIP